MTTCSGWDEKLSAYLDDRITVEEKKLVEEHLAVCSECRLTFSDLSKTRGLVQNLDKVEPPPWLTEKIMARVREEAEERKGIIDRLFYPFHIKIPLEVFAMCFVAVLSFYLYKTTGHDMTTFRESQSPSATVREESSRKGNEEAPVSRAGRPAEPKSGAGAGVQEHKEKTRKELPGEAGTRDSTEKSGTTALSGKDESRQAGLSGPEDTSPLRTLPRPGGTRSDSRMEAAEAQALEKKRSPVPVPAPPSAARAPFAPSVESARPKAPAGQGRPRAEQKTDGLAAVGSERQPAITVTAGDVLAANRAVEGLVRRYGGSTVIAESREGSFAVIARLQGDKVVAFQEALRSVGKVETKGLPSGTSEEYVSFRIDIRANLPGTGSSKNQK